MSLPRKISPDSILETVTEIRYESELPPEAIFGLLYGEFKDTYPEIEKLPIIQLPSFVRDNDPNLAFQPHYRLKRDNLVLQFGPKVFAIANQAPYLGWDGYKAELVRVLDIIRRLGLINTIHRIGLRYIDFFEFNIFEQIELSVTMKGEPVITNETHLKTTVNREPFKCTLQILNDAMVEQSDHNLSGSVIDIDTFRSIEAEMFFSDTAQILQHAHDAQKELFFRLLKPDFLASLNPEYEAAS